jgi:hypothetical protein
MTDESKPKPSFAPVYACSYPELAVLFRRFGYALAVHGSLQRDFDLIAIPWVKEPAKPSEVLLAVTTEFAFELVGEPTDKEHGRTAYSISLGHGHCALDVSFMPIQVNQSKVETKPSLKQMQKAMSEVFDVIDDYLGDTDPSIPSDCS